MSSWNVSFRRLGLYLCLPILQQAVYSQPANFKGDVSGVKVIRRLESYVRERAECSARIVNIESVPAIEALDGILAVPGLDGVLIGPHDHSCSLGIPEKYDHPRFLAAIETIFNKARAAGHGAGIHFWGDVDEQCRLLQLGANLLIHSAGISLFRKHLSAEIGAIKQAATVTRQTA